jgi:exosome complex RNA-binding protein Rrp4
MKRLALVLISMLVVGGAAFAHGDNDHVRGTVTAVTPQSITVQTPAKTTVTLSVTSQTVFEKSGERAQASDLKVGDRVIIDVPKAAKGAAKEARLVRFGAAKKAAAAHAHSH